MIGSTPETFVYVLSLEDSFAWHAEDKIPVRKWMARPIIMEEAETLARESGYPRYVVKDVSRVELFSGDVVGFAKNGSP